MVDIASLAVSLVPALLLLIIIYTRTPDPRENPVHVALTFASGMVSAAASYFVFHGLELISVYNTLMQGVFTDELETGAFTLLVIGPVEETMKLGAVVATACTLGFVHHPAEALIFSSAAALGFATAENWYAMWATGGPDFGRAILVPLLHVLFSSFSGWGIARSYEKKGASWPVLLGLSLAAAYHGLYNYLEFRGGLWRYLTLPLVAGLYLFFSRTLGALSQRPRYRYHTVKLPKFYEY